MPCKGKHKELKDKKHLWKCTKLRLENNFAATLPGYITAVCYDETTKKGIEKWSIKCQWLAKSSDGEEYIKEEYFNADTAFIVRSFGEEYASFVVQERNKRKERGDKYFISAPTIEPVSIDDKTIIAVNFRKGCPIYKRVRKTRTIEIPAREAPLRPIYGPHHNVSEDENESPRKIGARRQGTPAQTKTEVYYEYEDTGKVRPDTWSVKYSDKSKSTTYSEEELRNIFDDDYVNFVKDAGCSKYIPLIAGENKPSWLENHPNLIIENAPPVQFQQKGKKDLCISKAFASVLFEARYHDEASIIDREFSSKSKFFSISGTYLKVLYTLL